MVSLSLSNFFLGVLSIAFLNTGKKCLEFKQTDLYIDGWKVKQIKQIEAGLFQSEEIFQVDIQMQGDIF